jgi:Family of unknown function (DUF5946)
MMPNACPQCGATLRGDTSCQSIFESLLALEFSHTGYGKVHFLTVACYMIQHEQYSDEALKWMAKNLEDYLRGKVSPAMLTRLAAKETDQSRRTWKVTRQPASRELPKISWSMTISDVKAHTQDAVGYCAKIKQWARTTLSEMQPLLSMHE